MEYLFKADLKLIKIFKKVVSPLNAFLMPFWAYSFGISEIVIRSGRANSNAQIQQQITGLSNLKDSTNS